MKRTLVVLSVVMMLTLVLGATAASAQGPMGMGGGIPYIVKPGDTLSGIGAMFGVSFWEIARVNGIWNPNLIYVGQLLIIPVPGPMPGPMPGPVPGPGPMPGPIGWGGSCYPYWGSPYCGGGWGGGYSSWQAGGYSSWNVGYYPGGWGGWVF